MRNKIVSQNCKSQNGIFKMETVLPGAPRRTWTISKKKKFTKSVGNKKEESGNQDVVQKRYN